ncbi:hypothetical protein [Carbonactinospora thermoautotrophica]|uniref:hypothetical protein n=1 Tax=Carbonactinospora thermoautotrophica TaxID=1469144 RepID=UPI00082ACAD9|nr:hypothetical protein [Carbonactinospora thermoautotrophica]
MDRYPAPPLRASDRPVETGEPNARMPACPGVIRHLGGVVRYEWIRLGRRPEERASRPAGCLGLLERRRGVYDRLIAAPHDPGRPGRPVEPCACSSR